MRSAEEDLVSTQTVQADKVYLMPSCVKVEMVGGVEKYISYEDFIRILSTGTNSSTVLGQGFMLPPNTYYFANSATEAQLSCYYPERVTTIKYLDDVMEIVVPNVIISHKLGKGDGGSWLHQGATYLCTDVPASQLPPMFLGTVDFEKRAYLFPFSNTYPDGRMCFGQNAMPTRLVNNNFRALDWYYQYLFETPFNNDLGIAAVHSVSVSDWYKALKKAAKNKEAFPYDRLKGHTPR